MPKFKTCRTCGNILEGHGGHHEYCHHCNKELHEHDVKVKEITNCPDCGTVIRHAKCRKCGKHFEEIENIPEAAQP